MSSWSRIGDPWKAAFEQAVLSYLGGKSAPIGAVVVDAGGRIISGGGNAFARGRLAHAELNALSALPADADRTTCELYATLEPCPMCTGAIRMCQLRSVHFAAADPSAGSTSLLVANEFMQEFPCAVHAPDHSDMELASVALLVEYRQRTGHHRWHEQWRGYHPTGASLGAALVQSSAYEQWTRSSATAEEIYNQLVSTSRAT